MTRITAAAIIILKGSDSKGGTVGGECYRITKIIIRCFSVNIHSNLRITIDSGIILVGTNMPRIDAVPIIVLCTNNKGGTVGGYAHRTTKIITFCFAVNIQSKLDVAAGGAIILVDTNMTRIKIIISSIIIDYYVIIWETTTHIFNVIVVSYCTNNKGGTIGGDTHRGTKQIICGFTVNIHSKLDIPVDGGIILVDTNMTRIRAIAIIVYCSSNKGGTIGRDAHRISEPITSCFTVDIQSNLEISDKGGIILVNANVTSVIIISCRTNHKGATVGGNAH